MKRRDLFKYGVAAAAWAGLHRIPVARAADYPSRSIRCLVGYPPGGTTDLLGRLMANGLGKAIKQSLVVENKSGAGGGIGLGLVAHAAPDGYTLGVATVGNLALNYLQYNNIPYDAPKDFTCITNIANTPNVLLVNSKLPVHDLDEFIAYFKKKGASFFGSTGTGNGPHLMGELFKQRTGLNLTHVPYQGSAPAMTALLGGQIDMHFDNLPSVLGSIQGGQVRAIGVSSAERVAVLPEVKTLQEQGLKDFVINAWFAMVGPAGIDAGRAAVLASGVDALKADASFNESIRKLGGIPDLSGGQALEQLILAERKRWPEVVKRAGLKLQA